uniref:Uncharacterized protein n=1 Tax=Trichinella nativa TaxID=6335 RepID=A0A0V1KJF1_9BILA
MGDGVSQDWARECWSRCKPTEFLNLSHGMGERGVSVGPC